MNHCIKISDPFIQLKTLEERVRLAGVTPPSRHERGELWSGVKIRLLNQDFIIRLNEISELIFPLGLSVIPGCSYWVKGVVNYRGRLLPVFDTSLFFSGLGSGNQKNVSFSKILVIDKPGIFCGLTIQKMYGMQKFNQKDFTEFCISDAEESDEILTYVESEINSDGKNWYQLSIKSLAQDICSTDPAALGKQASVSDLVMGKPDMTGN